MPSDQIDWSRKGATLTADTAQEEFRLTLKDIHQATENGGLHYQMTSIYGNPCIRLLRSEVEALVAKRHGAGHLKQLKIQDEIAKANKEIRQLQKRLKLLQATIANLESQLRP